MTATQTFTADYAQEMHELASELQSAARLVGHLARSIPQHWDHPTELRWYMSIMADASQKAGNRIAARRMKLEGPDDLESASAEVLVELAALNVMALAWEAEDSPQSTNTLLTGGWWQGVAFDAAHRLQKYVNIGDEWPARSEEGDEA
jgi:hypothetical protein